MTAALQLLGSTPDFGCRRCGLNSRALMNACSALAPVRTPWIFGRLEGIPDPSMPCDACRSIHLLADKVRGAAVTLDDILTSLFPVGHDRQER